MNINVYKILNKTKVEGPGLRFCIWVQGCSRHCKGCWAKSTWSHNINKLMSVDEIFSLIQNEKEVEGVTFLGGEPFEQAEALSLLAQKVKAAGLSVMTFTGGNFEELKASDDIFVQNLLQYTDLLIDGAFEQNEFDLTRPWVGSKNQRYIFLSDRYCLEDINNYTNKVEVRIGKNGTIFINGMADFSKIKNKLDLQRA